MIYTHCSTRHEPPTSYGDCLRACIASITEREDVPHFADGGVDGDVAMDRMRQWLEPLGFAPFITAYPGDIALADLMQMMRTINPTSLYVLFGGTGGGDHCIVYRGGDEEWNPAWIGSRIVGPLSNGTWQVLVVGRI